MKYFVADGDWWLPSSPDTPLPGTLTFGEDDIRLTVHRGPLSSQEESWPPTLVVHPVVHGRTRDQTDVSLFEVRGVQYPAPGGGGAAVYSIAFGIEGQVAHADLLESFVVEYDYLQLWVNPPILGDPIGFDTSTVDMRPVVLAEASLPDALVSLFTRMSGTRGSREVHVEQVTRFEIRPTAPLTIAEALNTHVRVLSDLLSLCLDRRVRVEGISAVVPGAGPWPGTVFYRGADPPSHAEPSFAAVVGMAAPTLLWAENCPVDLSQVLLRWYQMHAQLSPVLVPLLAPHYASFMYAEHELGSTVNAAEALHKTRWNSRQLSPKDHASRVEAMIDAATRVQIDPSIVSWARRVLQSANYKPLRERVQDLLDGSGEVGQAVAAAESDFARNVVELRTGFAHGDGDVSRLTHPQRFWHERVLRWVIRCILIGELIEDPREAQRRAAQNQAFEFAVRRLADPEGND